MIGVFDSGLGGLTILKKFLNKLPEYDYVYLGDNARAPYGSKSQDVIYNYTREAVDFLFNKGCELIIVACNSASAKALRKIQREYLPNNFTLPHLLKEKSKKSPPLLKGGWGGFARFRRNSSGI